MKSEVLLQACKVSLLPPPEGAQQVVITPYSALLSVKTLFPNNKATGSELSGLAVQEHRMHSNKDNVWGVGIGQPYNNASKKSQLQRLNFF